MSVPAGAVAQSRECGVSAPEAGVRVTTTPFADGRIVQVTDMYGQNAAGERVWETISRRVVDTQEAQTRDALIALGWTPPA